MEYIYKTYAKETSKIKGDHKIATLSDLNLQIDATISELNDLFLGIYDTYPEYVFLLGNLFPYYYLEDDKFKHNISHFLRLLISIAKVYIVFGEIDYKTNGNKMIDECYLKDFYEQQGINVLNNKVENIDNLSLIGYTRPPSLYSMTSNGKLKEDILKFIATIESTLNNNNFKIFLTNRHKNLLKLELDFFKTLDLIISGQLPKSKETTSQSFLQNKNTEEHNLLKTSDFTVIGNGGANFINDDSSIIGEIDLIKILSKKR